MQVSLLEKNKESIKKNLSGKRFIVTFGAGCWSYDIKNTISTYGFDVDYALVDDDYFDGNTFMDRYGEKTKVVTLSWMKSKYDPQKDAIIWAIGNPVRLREYRKQDDALGDVLLLWDTYDFWEDRFFASHNENEFKDAATLLKDDLSVKTFWAYCNAQEGNVCDDIEYGYGGKTYFNDITKLEMDGCFVDCGAFDGESSIGYLRFAGKPNKIFAFEPDPNNYKILLEIAKEYSDFVCINKGCYSQETTLKFSAEGDMASHFDPMGGCEVKTTTIDKTVGGEKVAYIKMDIEGSELEALKGGRKTIERDMPILAISAYHRQDDFITLIPYINQLRNEEYKYDIYLRHHATTQTELVIYGIPVKV